MNEVAKIAFGPIAAPRGGTFVVFVGADLKPGERTRALLGDFAPRIESAAKTAGFKGKTLTALDILEPAGLEAARLLVVGVAPGKDAKPLDFAVLGGFVSGKLGKGKQAAAIFESPAEAWDASAAAEFALGVRLRAYRFEKYKTKKSDSDGNGNGEEPLSVVVGVDDPAAARAAHGAREASAEGVELARDLVNEPPNVLFPESFAERAAALRKSRRRGGNPRRKGDDQARHGRAAGRRAGLGPRKSPCRHALARREDQEGQTRRLRGQGRMFRFRRDFDQAGGGHGRHEGRHGRGGLRRRPDACARAPQGQGQRRRRDRSGRKHA